MSDEQRTEDDIPLDEGTDWRARYRWLRDMFQASEDGMFNWPYPMMPILSGPAFDYAVDQEIEKEAARAKAT